MTMTAEKTEITRWIPERNLEGLRVRIGKMLRKANKLGIDPVTLEVLGDHLVAGEHEGTFTKEVEVRVTGETPKIGGWTFVATLEHTAEGNILRAVPGIELPAYYRECPPTCDHCGLGRNRKDTYVVRSEDGTFKQVGRNCLMDFLGGVSPEAAVAMAEWLIELAAGSLDGDIDDFRGRGEIYFSVENYLAYVAVEIRQRGWTSRRTEHETNKRSTATAALRSIFPVDSYDREDRLLPDPQDEEMAEKAIKWVLGLEPEEVAKSDYLNNLTVTVKMKAITDREAGIAASAIIAYRRSVEKEVRKEAGKASEWFGEVKKREDFTLTFLGQNSFDSYYGTKWVVRLQDEAGNNAVWFSTSYPGIGDDALEIGRTYKVKATVKECGDYKGTKQTVLTRVKFLEKLEETKE